MSPEQPLPVEPRPPTGPLAGMAGTLLPSVLRTLVPLVYALLVRWGLIEWLGLDDAFVTYVLTTFITVLFYAVIRVAERYWDKIGWLIGFAARPALYVQGEVLSVAQVSSAVGTQTTVTTKSEDATPKAEGGATDRNFVALVVIAVSVVLIALWALFGLGTDKANGAEPVQQQRAVADFFYHGPVGNTQGFAVRCYSDGSEHWLLQGAYSQNAGNCPATGKVTAIYVPANFKICMRDYYNGAGQGCVFYVNGGGWAAPLPGAWYAWTVHL